MELSISDSDLCNVLRASLRGGCTLRTGRTGSQEAPAQTFESVSSLSVEVADGQRARGSPCAVSCPGRPEESARRLWACSCARPPVWSASGGGWGCRGASIGSSAPCPAAAAYSEDTSRRRPGPAGETKTDVIACWCLKFSELNLLKLNERISVRDFKIMLNSLEAGASGCRCSAWC